MNVAQILCIILIIALYVAYRIEKDHDGKVFLLSHLVLCSGLFLMGISLKYLQPAIRVILEFLRQDVI